MIWLDSNVHDTRQNSMTLPSESRAALQQTFILVSVVYAVAIGEPSFGNAGPLAVGLTLFAMVFAGQCTVSFL